MWIVNKKEPQKLEVDTGKNTVLRTIDVEVALWSKHTAIDHKVIHVSRCAIYVAYRWA